MASPMRIRATDQDGVVDVKVLMRHVMETGQRKDAEGKVIPGHFITLLDAKVNNKVVFAAEFGPAVSKDPYLNFKLKGSAKKGDTLAVTWVDNKGETQTDTVEVK
jgi:sulfur-oxidizing protein SoxZ